MPPGGFRVGEPLAERPVLREPLPVRVGGEAGGVDRQVAPVFGHLSADGGGHLVDAGLQERLMLAQLRREAVAGPLARRAPECGSEVAVLRDRRATRVGSANNDFAKQAPIIVRAP